MFLCLLACLFVSRFVASVDNGGGNDDDDTDDNDDGYNSISSNKDYRSPSNARGQLRRGVRAPRKTRHTLVGPDPFRVFV